MSPSTIGALMVDAATARMVALFRSAGIRSILLKGGALRQWLYPAGDSRRYGDIDLLVRPDEVPRCTALLIERGWRPSVYPSESGHADYFRPPPHEPAIALDLHRTFHFVTVSPERAWALLSACAVPIRLGGRQVEALDEAGLAVIVALHHARQPAGPQQTEDVVRALARAPTEVWQQASLLAQALGAREPFAAGLRDVERGAALADELGLPLIHDAQLALALSSPPRTAETLLRLLEARSRPLTLARILIRELAPAPLRMRQHYPLARRGRGGLLLAYMLRPLRLAASLPAGLSAATAARRATDPKPR